MILGETYGLLSARARRGVGWAVVARVAVALVEMVGVAAMVGIMLVVLGGENSVVARVQGWLGIRSHAQFVVVVCVALLLLFVLKSIAVVAINRAVNRYMQQLFGEMSAVVFDRYLHAGLLYVRSHNSAELINNTTAVCGRFVDGVVGVMLTIAGEAVMLAMITVALAIYDPVVLLLAVAVFVPFAAAYALFFRRRMVRDGQEENRQMVGQNRLMHETLRGYSDVEIYGAESTVARRFGDGLKQLARLRLRGATVRQSSGAVVEFSLVAGIVVMIAAGVAMGRDMVALRLSLGVFAVAAYKIAPSVSRIVNGFTELNRNRFAIERLKSSYELPITDYSTSEPMSFDSSVELRGVDFTYPNGREVLQGVNLTVKRGERIGISGASGVGKTTLINILSGLFEPSQGKLLVDGVEVGEQNCRAWQANIACVSQEVFLPDATLAENVAFGVEACEIDRERVRWALEAASLGEFLMTLSDGIDTVTGEAGARLSGGQRQRVGIARALYKGASLLLFDEATSSLDRKTEAAVADTLQSLSDGFTVIIISHNSRTLALCERVVEL